MFDRDLLPRDSVVAAALEMDLPAWAGLQAFGAASRQDRAVFELNWLVLDGSEDAIGQPARLSPGLAVIIAEAQQAPPLDGIGSDFVVKLQRAFLGLKEHRVPTRESLAVRLRAFGDLDRRRPLASDETGSPDRDVGLALGFSGEPSRHQRPVLRLDDRRRMAARHGIGLEDELRTDQAGLGGDQAGGREQEAE